MKRVSFYKEDRDMDINGWIDKGRKQVKNNLFVLLLFFINLKFMFFSGKINLPFLFSSMIYNNSKAC